MLKSTIKTKRHSIYVAEIGLNHNGDPDMARVMIEAAARAGADAVKFQTFVPELMSSLYTADLLAGCPESRPDTGLIDFFRRFVLSRDQYVELKEAAQSNGVLFFLLRVRPRVAGPAGRAGDGACTSSRRRR